MRALALNNNAARTPSYPLLTGKLYLLETAMLLLMIQSRPNKTPLALGKYHPRPI